jgi:hypothetical protein
MGGMMDSPATLATDATTTAPRQMLARHARPHELQWLVDRVGCHLTPDARGICVVDAADNIRAMAAFDWWSENGAHAHVAVDEPIALRTLAPVALRWFFMETGREVLVGIVRASNARALKLDKHLGFRETHRIRDWAAKGDDAVVLEMRSSDCRWVTNGDRSGHS